MHTSEHLRTPGISRLQRLLTVIHTLWWLGHGRAETVHVVASVTIITKQQLVLEQRRNIFKLCHRQRGENLE